MSEKPQAEIAGTKPKLSLINPESWIGRITSHTNFQRFIHFGLVDQSLLLLSISAGFSLDSVIARRIGVAGWGGVVGAGVGNVVADTIAGLPEGPSAAAGCFVGGSIPLFPIFIAMGLKRELKGRTAVAVGGTSLALCLATFGHSYMTGLDEKQD